MKLDTNLMTTPPSDIKNNRIQNLFRNLQKDPKSIFYSIENLSRTILNKARKSTYDKDKIFGNLYNQLEDKSFCRNDNLLRCLLIKEVIQIIQHFTLLVSLLNYCMLILLI